MNTDRFGILEQHCEPGHLEKFVIGVTDMDRYNPPEVANQANKLISLDNLYRCDIWAYGLLVWENLKDGGCYFDRALVKCPYGFEDSSFEAFDKRELRQCSIRFVKEMYISSHRSMDFARAAICGLYGNVLQMNPAHRASNLMQFPIMTMWK